MIRRPRVTVRRLMKWVGVAAVVLAVGRYPYNPPGATTLLRSWREGDALVQSYSAQCPTGVRPASWDHAVGSRADRLG